MARSGPYQLSERIVCFGDDSCGEYDRGRFSLPYKKAHSTGPWDSPYNRQYDVLQSYYLKLRFDFGHCAKTPRSRTRNIPISVCPRLCATVICILHFYLRLHELWSAHIQACIQHTIVSLQLQEVLLQLLTVWFDSILCWKCHCILSQSLRPQIKLLSLYQANLQYGSHLPEPEHSCLCWYDNEGIPSALSRLWPGQISWSHFVNI